MVHLYERYKVYRSDEKKLLKKLEKEGEGPIYWFFSFFLNKKGGKLRIKKAQSTKC